jgi:hypothetical protein
VTSFASSGTLFAQVKNGAPFDVFLPADEQRPWQLIQNGLGIPDSLFMPVASSSCGAAKPNSSTRRAIFCVTATGLKMAYATLLSPILKRHPTVELPWKHCKQCNSSTPPRPITSLDKALLRPFNLSHRGTRSSALLPRHSFNP